MVAFVGYAGKWRRQLDSRVAPVQPSAQWGVAAGAPFFGLASEQPVVKTGRVTPSVGCEAQHQGRDHYGAMDRARSGLAFFLPDNAIVPAPRTWLPPISGSGSDSSASCSRCSRSIW